MRKNIIILILSILLFGQINAKPYRQVNLYVAKPTKVYHSKPKYVKIQPVRSNVIVVRPSCPSPQHIWMDGDWVWNSQANQYVYIEGKWVVPASNSIWVPGHWKNTKYGWHWINGHWK